MYFSSLVFFHPPNHSVLPSNHSDLTGKKSLRFIALSTSHAYYMKKLVHSLPGLLLMLTIPLNGFSQASDDTSSVKPTEVPSIATDRPDQTECPYLVPTGLFQIETGTWIENDKSGNIRQQNITYNTSLLKYGVSKNFELRFIAEYKGEYTYDRSTDTLLSKNVGMNSVAIGTKIFICEQKGIIPKTSLIAHLQLPYFGRKDFRPNHLAPRFRFTMQNTITDRISLSYNLGGEWEGNTGSSTIIYTVSLAIGLVDRLGMYVEAYGFVTENSNNQDQFDGSFTDDHRFDMGFTYLLQNNLQLDVSGGVGLTDDSPDNFLSCGVSWRFPR